ncbi:MAG: DMT family transporter [Cyanobacteria bacterium J06631_2]
MMKYTSIGVSYAFCWGFGITISKVALSEISATTLLIIQLISSLLFLLTICYCKNGEFPLSRKSWQQGIAGIFEPALAYMAGTIGLSLTTATNASLIGSTEVVLTILCAAVILKEKLTLTKFILAGTSFSGIFFLIGEDLHSGTNSSFIGDLFVLLGVFFAVGYALLSKAQINKVNPLKLVTAQQFVGLIATALGFGVLSAFHSNYKISAVGIPLQFLSIAIISGIMQYALAFWLYLTALQTFPVSYAAFYVGLIPVFGVVSAILLLGEFPNLIQWIGAVLIILSSYFANRLQVS